MRHFRGSRRSGKGQRGQILVLFELVMIVILGFAAMVVDLGVLRNNRQILVNALDSAAMAGASMLPVDNATPGHTVTDTEDMIIASMNVNYPSLVKDVDYTITYRCLIRADVATGKPLISVDLPGMCDPHNALHHTPPLYAVPGDFAGAGKQRVSDCNPKAGDRCNVVVVKGSSTTQYALAPVVGVSSGSTGTIVSAACKGACGESTIVPVDLVIILDRTGSMADNFGGRNPNQNGVKIHNLQSAAESILNVYDPAKQRVALALTGPGAVDAAGDPTLGGCPDGGQAYGTATDDNFYPHTTLSGASTNLGSAPPTTVNAPKTNLVATTASTTLSANINSSTTRIPVTAKTGFPTTFPFTIAIENEQMTATGNGTGTSWTVQRAQNGTNGLSHAQNKTVTYLAVKPDDTTITVTSKANFPTTYPFSISIDSEQMSVTGSPSGTIWTVQRHQDGTTAAAHAGGAVAILLITATSTALPVTSANGFPTSGNYTVKVENEQMTVVGGQGTTLWTVTRLAGVAHNNSVAVSWDVDTDDLTIYVASKDGFPTSYPFTIQIDSEQMTVNSSPTSTTWAVTRGTGGPNTAAVHAGGKKVDMVVGKNDLTIRVASAIGFPATGNYIIQVDSERMKVGSVSGTSTPTTVMSVLRGQSGGGAAATHASGATVKNWTSWDPTTYNPSDPSSHTAGVWVPVGLSGTDTDTPLPDPNGAAGTYEVGGVFNTATPLVKAINCISASSAGTTLAMPIAYAHWYLDTYGRPGVTKGILLETDGHPEMSSDFSDGYQFTCAAAIAAGNAAKAGGIKVYAVGYGLGQGNNNGKCTDMSLTGEQLLKQVASGTEAPYYFNSPTGSDLATYFQQIAINLANGGAHLLQLYPVPVVDSVTSTSISGEYFTGADSVKFGAASAGIGSVTDTSISITLPSGLVHGQKYQVVVTTPGGSSYLTSDSEYTYP